MKSDIFWHSKAYSSYSSQPTGIGLGSLSRGNRWAYRKVFGKTIIGKFFLQIFKVVYFAQKKYVHFKKFHKIYNSIFFQKPIIGNTYIFTKYIDNFKFSISLKSYEQSSMDFSFQDQTYILDIFGRRKAHQSLCDKYLDSSTFKLISMALQMNAI